MKELTLVVDERELSTIKAALLLLQEQIDVLPEDLAEMLREHGRPMNEIDIDQFSRRLGACHEALAAYPQQDPALLGHRPPQL
jgi:hypothetical protein